MSSQRTQKALVVPQAKAPFRLESSTPIPAPGPGEVLLKVQAVGLNPVDWAIQAIDLLPGTVYPAVLGWDIAGEVAQVGEGVEGFTEGDRVFCQSNGRNGFAGYQQYTLASAEFLGKIPPNMTYSQAAAVPLTFATAAVGLLPAKPLGAGLNPTLDPSVSFEREPALVISGGSSVGQWAIQLLKFCRFSTIIAYASAKHTDYLRSLGATHIIDRGSVSFDELPQAVNNVLKKAGSAPLKLTYVAATTPESQLAGYKCSAPGGQIIVAHPHPQKQDEAGEENKGKQVISVYGSPHTPENLDFGRIMCKRMPEMLRDGILVPNRVENVPNGLLGIPDALKRFTDGTVSGVKLVALPQETA